MWAAVTKNLRLLRVSEAGKFKIKMLADLVSGEGLLPGLQAAFITVSSHDRRGEGAFWGLFYKDTNPIYEGSVLMT